jgi:hypothetical protein
LDEGAVNLNGEYLYERRRLWEVFGHDEREALEMLSP